MTLVLKPEWKRPPGRSGYRWVCTIKQYRNGIGFGDLELVQMIPDRVPEQAYMTTVINPRIYRKAWNFFIR
jgi:hypothetical protein